LEIKTSNEFEIVPKEPRILKKQAKAQHIDPIEENSINFNN